MSTDIAHHGARRETAELITTVWLLFSISLIYLEAPILYALTVSSNLVLQASIGTLAIQSLLRFRRSTLLVFCGPGMILGGALSFAVFQVAGRGRLGLVVLWCLGLLSCTYLLQFKHQAKATFTSSVQIPQLVGLSALVLSSEFDWLLAVAVGMLLTVLRWDSGKTHSTGRRLIRVSTIGLTLSLSLLIRGPDWWLITDDYQVFEVLARHVTELGPFTPWGAVDITFYHWLPYGWSGILDLASQRSEPLLALTRVMPFTYAVALTASLLLISQVFVLDRSFTVIESLPVWVLLATIRLDWAATTTAGVYAVLAAFTSVMAICLCSDQKLWRRLTAYGVFSVVVVLTKLPAALTLPALILAVESTLLAVHRSTRLASRLVFLTVTLGGLIAFFLLIPLKLATRYVTLIWDGTDAGTYAPQMLIRFGVSLSQNLSILLLISIAWLVRKRFGYFESCLPLREFLQGLAALFVWGLVMSTVIPGTEKANLHEYFSGPIFFLACLPILTVPHALIAGQPPQDNQRRFYLWVSIPLLAAALQGLMAFVTIPSPLDSVALRRDLLDGRILIALVFIINILLNKIGSPQRAVTPLLIGVGAFLSLGTRSTSLELFDKRTGPRLSVAEFNATLGSDDQRSVGAWLRHSTGPRDLIATNSLRDSETLTYSDDYSLALWSEREFLVLGPKFFNVTETAKEEITLCEEFGVTPTSYSAQALVNLGVRWFVIDLAFTSHRDWDEFGSVSFKTKGFWILELNSEPRN